jgi:phosphoribosylformylglycinamidine synthase
MHRVEVYLKEQLPDARGQGLVRDIHDLGMNTVSNARVQDVYWLDAKLGLDELELICRRLLVDPVTQHYRLGSESKTESGLYSIEVAYNAGVTDPVEETAIKACCYRRAGGLS